MSGARCSVWQPGTSGGPRMACRGRTWWSPCRGGRPGWLRRDGGRLSSGRGSGLRPHRAPARGRRLTRCRGCRARTLWPRSPRAGREVVRDVSSASSRPYRATACTGVARKAALTSVTRVASLRTNRPARMVDSFSGSLGPVPPSAARPDSSQAIWLGVAGGSARSALPPGERPGISPAGAHGEGSGCGSGRR